MKPELERLNFVELLHYGGKPRVQNRYNPPLQCRGYCVQCETNGNVFSDSTDSFDRISHGCSTSDYEEILEPLPNRPNRIDSPIMFLLENPGSGGCWERTIGFRGYQKKVPTKHYYWTPSIRCWPENAENVKPRSYGNFFAYLMNRHQLHNVYITNLIKCNKAGENKYNYKKARSNCVEKWLKKEIEIFKPRFVFAFGGDATAGFRKNFPNIPCKRLLHPASFVKRSELIRRNDSAIENFLRHA